MRTLAFLFALLFASCAHAPPGPPPELVWRGGDTGNSLSSENDCRLDLNLEAHSGAEGPFLRMDARNAADRPLYVEPALAKIEFTGGRVEIPTWAAASGRYEIPARGEFKHDFGLPRNSGFMKHEFLLTTFAIKDRSGSTVCEIHSTLVKVPLPGQEGQGSGVSEGRDTTSFDLMAAIGLPLARTSNLHDLGGSGPTFELMGTYFPSAHSGISLLLGTEGSTSNIGKAPVQAPPGGTDNLNITLFEAYFALDYTFRAPIGERWAVAYSAGPGTYYFNLTGTDPYSFQCYYYGDCNTDSQGLGSAFRLMVSQQLAVDYRLKGRSSGREGETGVGLALYDLWIPNGSWGPVPVSGSSFGAMLFFLTGW